MRTLDDAGKNLEEKDEEDETMIPSTPDCLQEDVEEGGGGGGQKTIVIEPALLEPKELASGHGQPIRLLEEEEEEKGSEAKSKRSSSSQELRLVKTLAKEMDDKEAKKRYKPSRNIGTDKECVTTTSPATVTTTNIIKQKERQAFPKEKFGSSLSSPVKVVGYTGNDNTTTVRATRLSSSSYGLRDFPSDKFDSSARSSATSAPSSQRNSSTPQLGEVSSEVATGGQDIAEAQEGPEAITSDNGSPTGRADLGTTEPPTNRLGSLFRNQDDLAETNSRNFPPGLEQHEQADRTLAPFQDQHFLPEADLVEQDANSGLVVEAREVTIKDVFAVKGVCCLFGTMVSCFCVMLVSLAVAFIVTIRAQSTDLEPHPSYCSLCPDGRATSTPNKMVEVGPLYFEVFNLYRPDKVCPLCPEGSFNNPEKGEDKGFPLGSPEDVISCAELDRIFARDLKPRDCEQFDISGVSDLAEDLCCPKRSVFFGSGDLEWAGTFKLDPGTNHTWSMQANKSNPLDPMDLEYFHPSMRLVIYATVDPSEKAIEAKNGDALALVTGDSCKVVEASETIGPFDTSMGSCYELHVGADPDSYYPMNTEGLSGMVVFAQHFPFEFERDTHYLADTFGREIEPVAQEGVPLPVPPIIDVLPPEQQGGTDSSTIILVIAAAVVACMFICLPSYLLRIRHELGQELSAKKESLGTNAAPRKASITTKTDDIVPRYHFQSPF